MCQLVFDSKCLRMLRLRRRRELDPLDKLFHRCRQDHDLGLQFHLTEVVELQKKLLVRGEDAYPAEGYEEFYRSRSTTPSERRDTA